MEIRESTENDFNLIYMVERNAFGTNIEADLTMELLKDKSAKPYLSLIAIERDGTIGHILFTKAEIDTGQRDISISILSPVAVEPEYQKKGVGGKLIETGLNILKERGIDLVFVAGHPEYYPKFGFSPAGILGFQPPYEIPEIHAGAWMVLELKSGILGNISGTISCADSMDKPEYWTE